MLTTCRNDRLEAFLMACVSRASITRRPVLSTFYGASLSFGVAGFLINAPPVDGAGPVTAANAAVLSVSVRTDPRAGSDGSVPCRFRVETLESRWSPVMGSSGTVVEDVALRVEINAHNSRYKALRRLLDWRNLRLLSHAQTASKRRPLRRLGKEFFLETTQRSGNVFTLSGYQGRARFDALRFPARYVRLFEFLRSPRRALLRRPRRYNWATHRDLIYRITK